MDPTFRGLGLERGDPRGAGRGGRSGGKCDVDPRIEIELFLCFGMQSSVTWFAPESFCIKAENPGGLGYGRVGVGVGFGGCLGGLGVWGFDEKGRGFRQVSRD